MLWPGRAVGGRGRIWLFGGIERGDTADAQATLRWYRPQSSADLNFPDGWPLGTDAVIEAAHYTAPRAAKGSKPAIPLFAILPNGGSASLKLDADGMAVSPTRTVSISASGKITVNAPATDLEKVQFSLAPATGLLNGSFFEQTAPRPTFRILKGAVLQKSNRAGGFFLAPGGGNLELAP